MTTVKTMNGAQFRSENAVYNGNLLVLRAPIEAFVRPRPKIADLDNPDRPRPGFVLIAERTITFPLANLEWIVK